MSRYDLESMQKKYDPDEVMRQLTRKAAPRTPHVDYCYVFGITVEGRRTTLGPFIDEHEADVILNDLDQGEIFKLPTRDLARATRIIKATIAQRGHDIDDSLSRHRHSLGRR